MKKIILALLVAFLATSVPANASVLSPKLFSGSVIYYSPDKNTWSTSNSEGAIKLIRKGDEFYQKINNEEGDAGESLEFAFKLKGTMKILENNTLFSVDNKNLHYYTAEYQNEKFTEKEMSAQDVQKVFPDATVLSTSDIQNGTLTTQKAQYVEQIFLIVNNTSTDYSKHKFSPGHIQRGTLRGCFATSRARDVKYSRDGDLMQNEGSDKMKIKVKGEPNTASQNNILEVAPNIPRTGNTNTNVIEY